MKIKFEGCRYTPSWETLQQAITECLGHNEEGVLTRISRRDRKCGYREPGIYDLTFRTVNPPGWSEESASIEIELTVE
jgi:hypothetical protein